MTGAPAQAPLSALEATDSVGPVAISTTQSRMCRPLDCRRLGSFIGCRIVLPTYNVSQPQPLAISLLERRKRPLTVDQRASTFRRSKAGRLFSARCRAHSEVEQSSGHLRLVLTPLTHNGKLHDSVDHEKYTERLRRFTNAARVTQPRTNPLNC